MPYSFSRTRLVDDTATNRAAASASIGVTSGNVGSGVADCARQNIWNPRKNCGSFVDATSSES